MLIKKNRIYATPAVKGLTAKVLEPALNYSGLTIILNISVKN